MRNTIKSNPFAQSVVYWQVLFTVPWTAAGTAEDSFSDISLSVSSFETDEPNKIWTLELICAEKPDAEEINRRLLVIAQLHNIEKPEASIQQLVQEDWLTQVSRSFPPMNIGRFYVHGSHVEEAAPAGSVTIQVDAGAAFGSGEHGTTSCCLKAIDWLANQRRFARILDMGTGSGILAIAAAKLWKTSILAVDIDPVSVKVTRANVRTNKMGKYITSYVSDGYSSAHVARCAPYDLILSNILARPLVAFAPSLAKHLQDGGIAVLSGLLVSQEKMVLAAHRTQGLKLVKRFVHQDWCTLVLEKSEKLFRLRNELQKQKLDAYIQPVHDEYMSEYPPAANRRVEWLSGFAGSAAGTAVVAREKAAMFVDGRYTLQAANQVDVSVYEIHNIADKTVQAWLAETLPENARVGYDAKLYTKAMITRMEAVLAKKNIALVAVENLIDALWHDRPLPPASDVFIHEGIYAGESAASKRARIADAIQKAGAQAAFLSAPESVNWLLNIRGRDVENTPLALAPAIIDAQGEVQLYIDPARISAEVSAHLGNHVQVVPPAALQENLRAFSQAKIMVDAQGLPVWYADMLRGSGVEMVEATDPCTLPKAIKNPIEIAGIKRAHIRDGAAIAKLLCWLDAQKDISELEVVEKLFSLRKQNELFVEPSFDTISGGGANGAIVHYRATEASNRTLKDGELFLLDSGGQYFDGTTDITRTVPIGAPSADHKDRFTRVLKGHIALAIATFPVGTAGSQIDAFARQYLWQAGLDYDHGTGHGVGCFSGVHEGPQRISKRSGDVALEVGMVVSNEPGYYKTDEYGIRIENLVTVVARAQGEGAAEFLGFKTLTCAPIDTRLVDTALLTAQEKTWLNDYHAWVEKELSVQLNSDEQQWLAARCKAI